MLRIWNEPLSAYIIDDLAFLLKAYSIGYCL